MEDKTMYRQYENPYKLEKQLEELKEEYCKAIETNEDEDTLINIACNIAELEERINFAWQDEEYDEDY
jgi:hypothetical protein